MATVTEPTVSRRVWTQAEFMALALESNRLMELVGGQVEYLEVPTLRHQFIVRWLSNRLEGWVVPRNLGEVAFAPVPIPLPGGDAREPDVFYYTPARFVDVDTPPNGFDLGIEVVSPSRPSRERDYDRKRVAYATAGVAEYWIVDPEDEVVTVLALDGDEYREHGRFVAGQQATSVLLPGFAIDVAAVWAAGERGR